MLFTTVQCTPFPYNQTWSSPAHQSGGEEYIVIHSSDSDEVLSRLSLSSTHPDVRYTFNNSAFRGFAAKMRSHCINALSNMSDVQHVEKSIKTEAYLTTSTTTRSNSPWGLQRISSASSVSGDPSAMDYSYSYANPRLGAGVDIYIVDTGINIAHAAFNGRARVGFSFSLDSSDGDGHGTHVAGTAAGAVFGVASAANLIAVKVLGPDGSGTSSDTIAGMDYVIQQHDARKSHAGFVGTIMSMSWGLTSLSPSITTAINAALAQGVHISLAAGNDGADGCNYSPSSAGGKNSVGAVTVGSIGISGSISSFSNTGSCVDIYAPGEDILSAWKDSPTTVNTLSGTSMACPHVTGRCL